MPIAQHPTLVIDCPDAAALGTFYATLLDWSISGEDDWVEIRDPSTGQCICFQQVADYRAPQWPGQEHPQQTHLDVMVADLDTGEAAVLPLGATLAEHQPGTTFRVFLDPAGHPFCLCVS